MKKQNQTTQTVSFWIKAAIILLLLQDLFGLWFVLSFYFVWG